MASGPNEVDRLIKRRRRMLVGLTAAFVAVQAGYFGAAERLAQALPAGTPRLVDMISVAGSLLWSLLLIRMMATGGRLTRRASPEAREALEDELTQSNRRAAFQAGYVALMFGAAALFAFSLFHPAEALTGIPALIALGALVPMLWFIVLDRRGESDG